MTWGYSTIAFLNGEPIQFILKANSCPTIEDMIRRVASPSSLPPEADNARA